MSKYTIHSTKSDYEERYAELKKMESGFAKGYLDWKKIRTLQLDNLDVLIAIIKRQVDKGLIELKN